ncbi:MAG: hypothetical protein ACXQS7_01495 [Candidatus Syntropharchaeia archaeon]
MQAHEIKIKARIYNGNGRKGWHLFNNKKVIEIKGTWEMEELKQLLGRLK